MVGRLPVYLQGFSVTNLNPSDSRFWGFVSVVIRLPEALASSGVPQLAEHGIAYELWRIQPDSHLRQRIAMSGTLGLVDTVDRDVLVSVQSSGTGAGFR